MAGCRQERCSKAADGHHPPAERRGSDGFERVLPCVVAYALDPCRRRSLGPTLELFVSFRPVAVLSWRLDMCLPPELTERTVTYRLELVGLHCYRDNTSECSVEGYSDTPVQVLGT